MWLNEKQGNTKNEVNHSNTDKKQMSVDFMSFSFNHAVRLFYRNYLLLTCP